jgi:hypothetical protein
LPKNKKGDRHAQNHIHLSLHAGSPPEQLQNYVKYIGTREGVEKIDESKAQLPEELLRQISSDICG